MPSADPQDVQAEEALLGAILVAPGSAKAAKLEADDFYRTKHGKIWEAAQKCARNGGCDVITVSAELERRGQLEEVGGRDRLARLAATVPTAGNAKAYAKRVREKAELRSIRRGAQAVLDAVEGENEEAIHHALDALGHPVIYVDRDGGEVIPDCPSCKTNKALVKKKDARENALLARITVLEDEQEPKARKHPLWDEVEAVHSWYCLATGHYGLTFGADEFHQALPRWKEQAKGKRNPCSGVLKAIAGAAFDPNTKRMKNGRIQRFDSFELITRSQEKFAGFQDRAPGRADSNEWSGWLVRHIGKVFK